MKSFFFVNPLSGSHARKKNKLVHYPPDKCRFDSGRLFSNNSGSDLFFCRQINETADATQVIVVGNDGGFVGYSPARITAVPDFVRIIV